MVQKECIVVLKKDEEMRLDVYLMSEFQGLFSRSALKDGLVLLHRNGHNAKLSSKVKNGDTIRFEWKNPIPASIEPEHIALNILYENEDLIVINKKQGMVVHPAHGNWTGTLVNALLFHWGKPAIKRSDNLHNFLEHEKRPGIVHRLDKDTSGTIIAAKNKETEVYLKKQFKTRRVIKQYIAICKGHPPFESGKIITQIIRDPNNPQKFIATEDKSLGKFAHTNYICIALYGPYALMKVQIKTGRTHQIRVHMKYINCPILGDPIYGIRDTKFKSATLMLHAQKLALKFSGEKKLSLFKSPTPIRFKKVMSVLHRDYERNSIWKKKASS